MSATEDFLSNNQAYAEQFTKGDLPVPPAAPTSSKAYLPWS